MDAIQIPKDGSHCVTTRPDKPLAVTQKGVVTRVGGRHSCANKARELFKVHADLRWNQAEQNVTANGASCSMALANNEPLEMLTCVTNRNHFLTKSRPPPLFIILKTDLITLNTQNAVLSVSNKKK